MLDDCAVFEAAIQSQPLRTKCVPGCVKVRRIALLPLELRRIGHSATPRGCLLKPFGIEDIRKD